MSAASLAMTLEIPPKSQYEGSDYRNGTTGYSARSLLKSASTSASKCIGVKQRDKSEHGESNSDTVDALSQKVDVKMFYVS
ncbi:unnamed protein product [Microthlaspi erraticum]|uniref:Uncharacterized protein n=1 Tax=Microthlaspi erraticum TaxID=1685480 RepID=A0A6D2HPA2_9BRAS|nr:unnamed protein product [Microthlaspi erraticum]